MEIDKKLVEKAREAPIYPRAWIGSRISYEVMGRMVEVRRETRIPLTVLVGYACLKTFGKKD